MMSTTQRGQDDLLRAKQQLEAELEGLRAENRNTVRPQRLNTLLLVGGGAVLNVLVSFFLLPGR